MSARRGGHHRWYRYPFGPGATGPSRIDQGQDFGGSGPIFAIGRAKILKTESPWPEYDGGAGILYELLEGPYKGKAVYVYEGVKASVRRGQIVRAGQQIGSIVPGTSSGIETGWANKSTGQPINHATYEEGEETAGGKAFGGFLALLKPVKPSEYGKPMTAAEKRRLAKLAGEEGGNSGIPGLEQVEGVEGQLEAHGVGGIAEGVINGIFGDLAKSAEPFMLNVALVGGGALLIYLGAAKLLGMGHPLAAPTRAATRAAALA